MLNNLLLLLVILVISLAVSYLSKLKMETSIFTTVCAITLIMVIAGILNILNIGLIIIYGAIVISFAYCLYYVIKNKLNIKSIIDKVFTPGTVVLILAFITYALLVSDKVLIHDDEAGSWARQVRYMFITGEHGGFLTHRNFIGFFSYFCLNIMKYSEGNLILSLWLFMWCCLVMPLRNITWKNWYKAAIYAIGAYCIINMIIAEPSYYMDTPLGVLAGALCLSWSFDDIESKDYIWLISGFIILMNIKDELGAVLGLLGIIYCVVCSVMRRHSQADSEISNKKTDKILDTVLLTTAIGFLLSSTIVLRLIKIFSGVQFVITAFIVVFSIAVFVLIIVFRKKLAGFIRNNYRAILIILAVSMILIACVGYYLINGKVDVNSFRKAEYVFNSMWNQKVIKIPAYFMVCIYIMIATVCGSLLIKQDKKKKLAVQAGMIIAIIIIYSAGILADYIMISDKYFELMMDNLRRYQMPIFIFSSLWFMGRLLLAEEDYKSSKAALICGLAFCALLMVDAPIVGNTALANLQPERYTYTYELRPEAKAQAEFLASYADKDEEVLIIDSGDCYEFSPYEFIIWLRFELIDYEIRGLILTAEDSEYSYTTYNEQLDNDTLTQYIQTYGSSYVYIVSMDSLCGEGYEGLLPDDSYVRNGLYKVDVNNDDAVLEFVAEYK